MIAVFYVTVVVVLVLTSLKHKRMKEANSAGEKKSQVVQCTHQVIVILFPSNLWENIPRLSTWRSAINLKVGWIWSFWNKWQSFNKVKVELYKILQYCWYWQWLNYREGQHVKIESVYALWKKGVIYENMREKQFLFRAQII